MNKIALSNSKDAKINRVVQRRNIYIWENEFLCRKPENPEFEWESQKIKSQNLSGKARKLKSRIWVGKSEN